MSLRGSVALSRPRDDGEREGTRPVSAPAATTTPGGAYQMLRLRARALRRLPFGRGGRLPGRGGLAKSRPPPNPPPGPRRSSVASFTRSLRPPSSKPSNFWIASAACSSLVNSTNAKPRGRPLMRSVGRTTCTPSSPCANRSWSSSDVVSKFRFPTNTLELIRSPFPVPGCRRGQAAPPWRGPVSFHLGTSPHPRGGLGSEAPARARQRPARSERNS